MQQNKMIPSEEIQLLRNSQLISDSEIAYWQGDLFIVEDVLSGTKRMLDKSKTMILETKRRMILHG